MAQQIELIEGMEACTGLKVCGVVSLVLQDCSCSTGARFSHIG